MNTIEVSIYLVRPEKCRFDSPLPVSALLVSLYVNLGSHGMSWQLNMNHLIICKKL